MASKSSTSATSRVTCGRCGMAYGKRQGNFYVSYAEAHRGIGYLPICKNCLETMYQKYYEETQDPKLAVRQICRKLDLYWSERIYKTVIQQSTPWNCLTSYLGKLNRAQTSGKSYDDTLREENALWIFSDGESYDVESANAASDKTPEPEPEVEQEPEIEVPDDVVLFWGTGYTPAMYLQLEERRQYWMSGLPEDMDTGVGAEAIIRQICFIELDINRDRAEGKNIDKLASTLSNLIGSLNLKPSQKKDDVDASITNTPMGVWIYRYENERPLPDDESENKIRKTVFTWMGHVCKMLKKKNAYADLYDQEIERLRVERPEFDDLDDEEFMMEVVSSNEDGGTP